MVSSTLRTMFGARPSEGSSNMISSGAPIRQRAIASICCSPPESVPAGLARALGEHRKQRQHAVAVLPRAARARGSMAPISRFSATDSSETPGALPPPGRCRDRRRDGSASRQYPSPRKTIRPRGRGSMPAMRPDQRGLARAVGADDGDDRALFDVERHAVERLDVAIKHVEVFDLQHQTASAPR